MSNQIFRNVGKISADDLLKASSRRGEKSAADLGYGPISNPKIIYCKDCKYNRIPDGSNSLCNKF